MFLTLLLTFTSCKKDTEQCESVTELTNQNHLVDLTLINQVNELNDTLTKYPQLQVSRVINDPYLIGMHCNVFYKGLIVFTDQYSLFKSKSTNEIFSLKDYIVDTVDFTLTPTLDKENAITIAKQTVNFNNSCTSYRLGIYDLNASISLANKNYKLVWKVQGDNGAYVVIDAQNGEIYASFDGVWH